MFLQFLKIKQAQIQQNISLNIQYFDHIQHESCCVKSLASELMLSALVALFVLAVLTLYTAILELNKHNIVVSKEN